MFRSISGALPPEVEHKVLGRDAHGALRCDGREIRLRKHEEGLLIVNLVPLEDLTVFIDLLIGQAQL